MNAEALHISVVSYLNSKPFLFGLRNTIFKSDVIIEEDIPSVCAEKLLLHKADIGLVPVTVLPVLKNYKIISDYCIGSRGSVDSVLLLSDVPLNEIKNILLDYQSRTSVMLTKVLAKEFWHITPEWAETTVNYEKTIAGDVAGVVIGDRAMAMKKSFNFVYDLSEEWHKFTGLPFVFACWVSIKKLSPDFIFEFNSALKFGLDSIAQVSQDESSLNLSPHEITHYLTKKIDFHFDDEKRKALQLFQDKVGNI